MANSIELSTSRTWQRACLQAAIVGGMTCPAIAQAQVPDRITLGAGAAIAPAYYGSKDVRILPVPIVEVKKGAFYANLADGAGVYVVDTDHFRIGGGLNFVRGYRDEDVPDGIDGLSNTAGVRMFARYTAAGTGFTLGATRSIGGTKGFTVEGRLSHFFLIGRRLTLVPTVALTWADGKSQQRYFGIDSGESTASGLPVYSPSSDLRDLMGTVTANYRLARSFNLTATVGATTLFDQAHYSPLVERRTAPLGLIGISRSF